MIEHAVIPARSVNWTRWSQTFWGVVFVLAGVGALVAFLGFGVPVNGKPVFSPGSSIGHTALGIGIPAFCILIGIAAAAHGVKLAEQLRAGVKRQYRFKVPAEVNAERIGAWLIDGFEAGPTTCELLVNVDATSPKRRLFGPPPMPFVTLVHYDEGETEPTKSYHSTSTGDSGYYFVFTLPPGVASQVSIVFGPAFGLPKRSWSLTVSAERHDPTPPESLRLLRFAA